MKILLKIFIVLFSACAAAFDFSSYSPTTVANLRTSWDATTKDYSPGLSILPFQKLKIRAVAVKAPDECKPKQLEKVLTILGLKDFLQAAPVNHCILLREKNTGYNYFAYIQDALVAPITKEVSPGDEIDIFTIFPAYTVRQDKSQNMPMLLITEFQKP